MKSMLKERKKAKSKKDEAPEDGKSAVDDMLGDLGKDSGVEESKPKDEKPKDEKPEGDDAKSDAAPSSQAPDAGGDPVKVFVDVLDMDEMTAQAVFAEASSMPELSEMDPAQMAKKIKGNYDLLKKIITSMGEKAKMAMDEQLNQPMDMPDMGGPGGPGGPAGPGPGPGAGGPPPMA